MIAIAECPISSCPWRLEHDAELEARNVAASPQVAAALGTPLDAFLSIRSHQLAVERERALADHFATHPVLDWVTDLMAARAALTELAPGPSLAHSIEVDWDQQSVTIEGRPLPWHLAEEGPRVDSIGVAGDELGLVWLPVLSELVSVIGDRPIREEV